VTGVETCALPIWQDEREILEWTSERTGELTESTSERPGELTESTSERTGELTESTSEWTGELTEWTRVRALRADGVDK
jgi:hypothetical protein